jgi:hypothetical protein
MGRFPIKGASCETKVPLAVPVAKPLGRALTPSIKLKYSSLDAKSGSCVGVSVADVVLLSCVPPLGRTETTRALRDKKDPLRAKAATDVVESATNMTFVKRLIPMVGSGLK